MSISRYKEFISMINEKIDLPILDIVIDDGGVVYNSDEAELIKGRVERTKQEFRGPDGRKQTITVVSRILGDNGKDYPLGIDKNGNVIALHSRLDDQNRVLDSNGNPIPVLPEVRSRYKIKYDYYYQSPEYDYFNLIPIIPTGWVNVKIDMEVVKRVRRYSKTLGSNTRGHKSFLDKLEEFQKLSSLERENIYIKRLKRGRIQKEMSCILMLRYIDEIKDFFNPSQSGFLFESFISGLIPNSRTKEDNSPVDIKSPTDRYQLKFVDFKANYSDMVKDLDGTILDYYIISVKYVNRIEILIINGREITKRLEEGKSVDFITTGERFKMKELNILNDETILNKFKIDLTNIEGRILNLGESLKNNLDNLYRELSDFQYNIETITTGTTQDGKVIREQSEFDVFHLKAERNILNLKKNLNDLVSDINR